MPSDLALLGLIFTETASSKSYFKILSSSDMQVRGHNIAAGSESDKDLQAVHIPFDVPCQKYSPTYGRCSVSGDQFWTLGVDH